MRINVNTKFKGAFTHEGGKASANTSPMQALRRTLLSCLLWEDGFYEDGVTVADRIKALASEIRPDKVAALAIEARTKFNLRHAPLLLLTVLAKTASGTNLLSNTIPQVVKRADEVSELLALYWKDGKKPISAQLKKGLAKALNNFSEYQLAKYNRDTAIKLRDVLFLTHAKPAEGKEGVFFKLAENKLETPDTWEVALSGGADKKETFERLIREQKLGYLALLRNLRNMKNAGVAKKLVEYALASGDDSRVLPFRFVAAARAVPEWEDIIDVALLRKVESTQVLKGKTVVLVDVSGSMDSKLSSRSDLTRMDAACALSSIIRSEDLVVFSFSNQLVKVPSRRGMAGVDAVAKSQMHGGTYLGGALAEMYRLVPEFDRLIVITDEQSGDTVSIKSGRKNYVINVASNKNGIGYGSCVHIDGFSERVLDFIYENEDV